ncbi:hypothetical protein DID74_00845 [Candidatus Marinamargulisbacteria bacterium SCGC AG-333-B06]|nr:hypothetical protein DID74_00845 [Candidatus Marinamargulisbacteria bacterium SCGC AG-333-B06]
MICYEAITTEFYPEAHERWSYRHYETILSKTVCLSTKLDQLILLIPLPFDGIVEVLDYEPISPFIDKILEDWNSWKEKIESNYTFLNKYLHNGSYSKKKPLIFERFMNQLP